MSEYRNLAALTFVRMDLHASFIHKVSGSKSLKKRFQVWLNTWMAENCQHNFYSTSKLDWPCCTTCLALQQSSPVFLDEVSIWRITLNTFDVQVDIVDKCFLQSLWWNTSLESCTWSVPRTCSTQFIQHELVNMVVIPIHVIYNFCKVSENRVWTFNHYLGIR